MLAVQLLAWCFLKPSNFRTEWDSKNPERAKEQYASGLLVGRQCTSILIAINDVWYGALKSGDSLQSYERIGYHAHTEALLRGLLDSGVPIYVTRMEGQEIERYRIQ